MLDSGQDGKEDAITARDQRLYTTALS